MSTITAKTANTMPTTPGEIRWFPEASDQSFLKGNFVYLVNGKLTECASDAPGIAGIAEADASGTVDTAIPITLAKRGQQFTVHANTATAVAQVGAMYGIVLASSIHYVDISDTTNKRFVVDDIANDDAVGDTYGRLIVEVCKGYAQLDMTTS